MLAAFILFAGLVDVSNIRLTFVFRERRVKLEITSDSWTNYARKDGSRCGMGLAVMAEFSYV